MIELMYCFEIIQTDKKIKNQLTAASNRKIICARVELRDGFWFLTRKHGFYDEQIIE